MSRFSAKDRIDAHIVAAATHVTAGPRWQVADIVRLVRQGIPGTKLNGLDRPLEQVTRITVGWAFDRIILIYVHERVRAYLKSTATVRLARSGETVEMRLFESYRDAEGRHQWQRVTAMTKRELTLAVEQRKYRIAREQQRVSVYEALLKEMSGYPETARVSQVWAKVVNA